MTNNILLKFAKKGINLSPDAYEKVMKSENPLNFASDLIVKLKSSDFKPVDLISISGETVDEITGNIDDDVKSEVAEPTPEVNNKTDENPDSITKKSELKSDDKKDTKSEGIIKIDESEKIEDAKIEFKRNLEKIDVEYDFEVLQDSSKKSYTSGEIGDLITYFQSRYEKLSKIYQNKKTRLEDDNKSR